MVSSYRVALIIALVGVPALLGGLAIDASGDGLRVYEDVLHHSDPLAADTDGDGLTDYEEVHKHDTDPTDSDSDNDRLSDYEEVVEYGSNPTTQWTTRPIRDGREVHEYGVDPAKDDTDGDGLTDADEIREHDTDPNEVDTDGDGLSDYEEVNDHETSPGESDTDGDDLTDYEEVNEYGTDPSLVDSRGTGITDAQAVQVLDDPMHDPTLDEREQVRAIFEENPKLHLSRPISDSEVSNTGVDSSGDGFSDAFSEQEANLTTDEIDIFVQVTYAEGHEIPISSLLLIQQAFDEAPVTNANGEEVGINLHFYVRPDAVERSYDSTVYSKSYADGRYDFLFTAQGYGFYHVFVADTVIDSNDHSNQVNGIAMRSTDGVIVEEQDSSKEQAALIMHELGHQLGLWEYTYEGIDSGEVAYEKYPSVMNYWESETTVDYSDGKGFDDWGYIEENYRDNRPVMWYIS